jgi:Ser/Thr protein kinase RdoA (MazF antagonist)
VRKEAGAAFTSSAVKALEAFDVRPVEVSLVAQAENVTFRVKDQSAEVYALRLHRPGYHTLEELQSERLWTKALSRAGLHVPQAILTRDGRDYAEVEILERGERRWVSLARWAPGEILGPILRSEASIKRLQGYFRDLGVTIAAMHNMSVEWRPPDTFRRHALDADGLMGPDPFWGRFWVQPHVSPAEGDLLLKTRDRLHHLLSAYGKDPSRYGVIHADLHPGNVLVSDGVLAAIDFDDAGYGWLMYDLAVALHGRQDFADFPAMRDACIAGYRTTRPIAEEDLAMLPIFLLARGMAEIGWFGARPETAAPAEIAAAKDVTIAQCRAFEAGRLA